MIEHQIEALSGRMFDFDAPTAEQVSLDDISRSLGNTCRFGGHCSNFYSVAEHAVLVHDLVDAGGHPPDVCLAALHHDSHEAYLGDVPTPLKRKIKAAAPGVWEDLERSIDDAICVALDIDPLLLHCSVVQQADAKALSWEAAVLKPSGTAQSGKVPDGWVKASRLEVPAWAVRCREPLAAGLIFGNVARSVSRRVCLSR